MGFVFHINIYLQNILLNTNIDFVYYYLNFFSDNKFVNLMKLKKLNNKLSGEHINLDHFLCEFLYVVAP